MRSAARRPGFPQFALVLAAVGAVGYGLGRGVAEIARYVGAHDFVELPDKSNSAATDALSPPAALIGQIIWQAAALALGFAFVLICLNAMRVGLLTRFMGVLGIIVGVTFVLPLDSQGIIRVFWLAALGVLFARPLADRHPQGVGHRAGRAVADPAATARATRRGPAERRGRGGQRARDSARERARHAGDPAAHGSEPAPSRSRRRRQRARRVEEEEAQAALLSARALLGRQRCPMPDN